MDSSEPTIEELNIQIAGMRKAIDELQKTVASKQEIIEQLRRMLFGKKSEKVVWDPSQLLPGAKDWFAGEPGPKKEKEKTAVAGHEREKHQGQKNAGWNGFPEDLEHEEKIIDVPENERRGLSLIGYDVSEKLVYRTAYVIQVVKRAKYADPGAPWLGVVTAPLPPVPSCFSADSDRCRYDLTVVAHVIAAKLVDHIPFYRQSEMFARMGVEFGRSAMCMYFAKASAALGPLYSAMAAEVMGRGILHADETGVRMLEPQTGKTKTCWIWVRKTGLGPPLTVFHFSRDRSSATAVKLLGEYTGTVISDRFAAYGKLPAEAAGCWAHARRYFFKARESRPEYAFRALELVRRIYGHEQDAKDAAAGRDAETALFKARKRFRLQSAPLVRQYFELCREIRGKEPPSSLIAKAAAYSLNQEEALCRFLTNPKLNIDNNPCENIIRPFCIGRKNWLFVGNEGGGTSMAVLASFAASCKDNGVDFEKWLCDVLPRLDTCPAGEIRTLLPHLWKPAEPLADK